MIPTSEWLNALLQFLQAAQYSVLRLLHAVGLTGDVHGQPAWPFPYRIAGETLMIDVGQARQLALSLGLIAAALVLTGMALLLKRRLPRLLLVASAVAAVGLAPWPSRHVAFAEAQPASFHRSPTGFSAAAVVQGQALFAQHCVACHGADGRGQGPIAASQPVWPPDLAGPLLWRRADGDLFWTVLHGKRDRRGTMTMPAFDTVLHDRDVWALIDYMKALGAGQALKTAGLWPQPIAMPDFEVRCDGQAARAMSTWRGQRVRLVASGAGSASVMEDPRLVTVRLLEMNDVQRGRGAEGCASVSLNAWSALAVVAGVAAEDLPGTQFISDRQGWLRARGLPGKLRWTESDLLCRSEAVTGTAANVQLLMADGLSALIAGMDAEPVRYVKGGFVH